MGNQHDRQGGLYLNMRVQLDWSRRSWHSWQVFSDDGFACWGCMNYQLCLLFFFYDIASTLQELDVALEPCYLCQQGMS